MLHRRPDMDKDVNTKLLIVNDAPANLKIPRDDLESEGYEILEATSEEAILEIASSALPDLILLCTVASGIDVHDIYRQLKQNPSTIHIPVIPITDQYSRKETLLALVQSRLEEEHLVRELRERSGKSQQRVESREQPEDAQSWDLNSFVGESQAARKILDEVHQIQRSNQTSVLIMGESGTGKELIARAIHLGSDRASGPFIPVNCSAVPRELAESTFFGHIRGAFSGASESHKGYFELAHGGTLFLDEIGDMPMGLQPKLLRVLEDGYVMPVGGTRPLHVDVRIIAAASQNLMEKVVEGKFREELYFRLDRFTIRIPPLRERREDIRLLAEHFLRMFSSEIGIPPPDLSHEALKMLESYYFPGNVRELRNIIERALLRNRGETIIRPGHLHLVEAKVLRNLRTHPAVTPQEDQSPSDLKRAEQLIIKRAGKSTARPDEADTTSPVTYEEKILRYARERGSITSAECQELLSVDRRRSTYLLKKLCRYGLLVSQGELRWSYYLPVHDDKITVAMPTVKPEFTVDGGVDQLLREGDTVSIIGSFAHSGTHTATIDWGDGSLPQAGIVNETNGLGIVTATHIYTSRGRYTVYTVTLTITDDAGVSGIDTITVTIVPGIIYVDNITGDDIAGDGSPGNAYRTIQYGIEKAIIGCTVQVADGTYAGPGNVNLTFRGKAITVKSANGAANCIIDCENVEGTHGFYFYSGEDRNSILDGFTIMNGNAYTGGGVCCYSSSPTVANAIIMENRSSAWGGGVHCNNSSPLIKNTIIKGNVASGHGGGICIYSSSSPTITNTVIAGNKAGSCGGGIYCVLSSAQIANVTITGNMAAHYGNGIYSDDSSSVEVINTILWANSPEETEGGDLTVSYSDIQGGFAGLGNIDIDPLFVDADNGDYHLSDSSPCIGAGTSDGAPAEDIEGNPRGSMPSMGAYEAN